MIGPLINLLTRRPDLIIDHIASYAALAQNQLEATKRRLVVRIAAAILALAFGTAALVLGGVGLMLATSFTDLASTWALIAAPVVALLVSIISGRVAFAAAPETESQRTLGDQFRKDLNALKIATGEHS